MLENIDFQSENIGQRLREIRKEKGETVEQFYGPLMKSFSNGSSIENFRRKLGPRLAKDIIEYHHINPDYLATGKGEKFLAVRKYRKGGVLAKSEMEITDIPFYNVTLAEFAHEESIWKETPEYYINFRPFNDCRAYLPVYGDSMHPRYVSGEIIAIREISNPDVIQWGEAYLVITDERANNMATVKLLFQHTENDKIILRASNPEYSGDTVIAKDAIRKLYIIKGKITRHQL